ncbi:MAG: DUF5717 family protein [Acetatifactor sp.]|nr:DUF5717 family protein [Acetatifactor sp.]
MERIFEGKFDFENNSLDFSCSKLEMSVLAGECLEGSFYITSSGNTPMEGFITTSDIRMELPITGLSGNEQVIFYKFHGENLEEGEVVKGSLNAITNMGEFYLPFVVTVEHRILKSSIGPIKNLFHFANLAKSNWLEALAMFYSDNFKKVFVGSDASMCDVYKGLSANKMNSQNMEEFLIHINKKSRVEYIVEENEFFFDLPSVPEEGGISEFEINIKRNGWGYTFLNVECDGDFLYLEKTAVTDDDFLGNVCRFQIYADTSKLRDGNNFGVIHLFNSVDMISIPVTITVGNGVKTLSNDVQKHLLMVKLVRLYQDFRIKKINATTWRKDTGRLVESLLALDDSEVGYRLIQAQLLISEERYNEAEWILEHSKAMIDRNFPDRDEYIAYYLYLTTLIHRDEDYVNDVAGQVQKIYSSDVTNWRVAWLLLYLSEEYSRSASGKWVFLEKQFNYGCFSPILYMESILLLNMNPMLLHKLDNYELQVLHYGAKQQFLNEDLCDQLLYLSGRKREFSALLLDILQHLYEKSNDERVLQEICSTLIKGNKTENRYFKWYEAGVLAELRITNLYEYYMMSIDTETVHDIPKTVLMYFSYQNNLEYRKCAYMYDYIVKNKENIPDVYMSFENKIEHFVIDQIKKMHVNIPLTALYQRMLRPEMISEETCEMLSRILFAHRVTVEDDRLRKVYVYKPGSIRPECYMIKDKVTWVSIYGSNNVLVFEDSSGNLFTKSVEYTIEKLMIPGRFLRTLSAYDCKCPDFDLYLVYDEMNSNMEDDGKRYRRVLESDVEDRVKKEISIRLLQYYYDTDKMRELDEYLDVIPMEKLGNEGRNTAVKYMVLRGKYELAYSYVEKFGPYFVDPKVLVRLVGEMILTRGMEPEEMLVAAAGYAFKKGKYNNTVLQYLCRYQEGCTKELRDLWKAAMSFDLDVYRFSEKLMSQMLVTGAYIGERIDIFKYYVNQGGNQIICNAFLVQCSYDYFVKGKVIDNFVFRQIRFAFNRGETLLPVCKLAFLKYFAENSGESAAEDRLVIRQFLEECIRQGIYFTFFLDIPDCKDLTQTVEDKTIIEYRPKNGNRVKIHYIVAGEEGDSGEYVTEYMREVVSGVCVKDFILFFGETLQYYITEDDGVSEEFTESGNIQRSDMSGQSSQSLYGMINDIVISKSLADYDTTDGLVEDYYMKEYTNSSIFTMI